jgi:hypothetical protein
MESFAGIPELLVAMDRDVLKAQADLDNFLGSSL